LSGIAAAMGASKLLFFLPIQYWAVRRIFAAGKAQPVEATSKATA